MTNVVELNAWAGRLVPGRYALHPQFGMCRVIEARGLFRLIRCLLIADRGSDVRPSCGAHVLDDERVLSRELTVSVYSLREGDPLRDLRVWEPPVVVKFQARPGEEL